MTTSLSSICLITISPSLKYFIFRFVSGLEYSFKSFICIYFDFFTDHQPHPSLPQPQHLPQRHPLEGEGGKLGRLLEESLLKADRHTELVVDEPNLVEVNDGHTLLPLLDSIERDGLLLHRVRLRYKRAIRLGENLEFDGRWILLLTRANHGLVECLLENGDVELLTEPLLRVGSDGVDNNIIERLELVMELHRLGVIRIERKIERIGCAPRGIISESTHTIRRPHERELDVELLVVASVEIDGLTAILVLTKFRKLHSISREFGGALDSERHFVVGYIYVRTLDFK